MPDSNGHSVFFAILAGVPDLQRSSVTHDQLKQLVELQRAEFQMLVRAETEPLNTAVEQIHSSICRLAQENEQTAERMRKIESKVDQFQNTSLPSPTRLRVSPNDPGYKRLTFRGLDDQGNPWDRIDAIERFMKQHFPRVKLVIVENHYKSDVRNKVHNLSESCFCRVHVTGCARASLRGHESQRIWFSNIKFEWQGCHCYTWPF